MSKTRIALVVPLALLLSTSAFAQATRTWVSGVGDDVNPCSRTAPCKTFAGAISKTAAGGLINVLDPGGFGAVTITKAMTIDGSGGSIAGVLSSGTQGIVITAGTSDVVMLRNLDIEGAGTTLGTNGVRVLQAGRVAIEKCRITQYSTAGLNVTVSQPLKLVVTDSEIYSNNGDGIDIIPSSGTPVVTGSITRTIISNNSNDGIHAANGVRVSLQGCTISGNTTGARSEATAGVTVLAFMNTEISQNGTGLVTQGSSNAFMRLEGSTVEDNITAGFTITAGSIVTFQDNYIQGNGTNTGSLTTASKS